ncbi:hypothetical protein F5Y12DRAFT_710323 [Xylaria sp. FL1777]|nr:hypothetical protein F5Y12DRAFT_710323 [Xylaria sp. FL1777]
MGLPLFIPPVESDVPSKPSTKSRADPSHARSPIRRTERRRQLNETREESLRMLNALQAAAYNTEQSLLTTLHGVPSPRPFPHPADAPHSSERQSPRLENPRISELTDLERRHLGRAATSELSRGPAIDDLDDAWNQLSHVIPSHFQTIQSSSTQRSNALPLASRHGPTYTTRRAAWRRRVDRDNEEPRSFRSRYVPHRDPRDRVGHSFAANATSALAGLRHAQRVRYVDGLGYVDVDGLGDRDRSLSPEGDGVWDTLQSTLTPDPQPPSVGSSFASTITATTSETNGSTSVNTSITTPNEETEPPCDPVTDNPGSDGEDDVGERPSRQTTPRLYRSYAEVVSEAQSRQSTESSDASDPDREWLSGMHRIVRGLASRVDIPDEWWAQAGLSRSMSWED